MEDDIAGTHAAILSLQREMTRDRRLKALCEDHGLPWDLQGGYEPRGYNGPPPEEVRLLVLLAEPGAITRTEAEQLRPAISHSHWITPYDLRLQEHYWRAHLLDLCRQVWLENTEDNMYAHVGKSNTFWMSLPRGAQTSQVPRQPLQYFLRTYLARLLALFPNAIFLAAGGKAQSRLRSLQIDFLGCSAFTRPESNKPSARDSYQRAAQIIAGRLAQRWR